MDNSKATVRCSWAKCKLNQFITRDGRCRRCHKPLPSAPAPVMAEVVDRAQRMVATKPVTTKEGMVEPKKPVVIVTVTKGGRKKRKHGFSDHWREVMSKMGRKQARKLIARNVGNKNVLIVDIPFSVLNANNLRAHVSPRPEILK